MKTRLCIRDFTFVLLTLSLAPLDRALGQAEYFAREQVIDIAAVSNADIESAFRSGLFVSYLDSVSGRVTFFEDGSDVYDSDQLFETSATFRFDEPTAIAVFEDFLVVWDNARSKLVRIDLRTGRRKVIVEAEEYLDPSQLAISPEGLIILIDGDEGQIYWTTLDGGNLNSLDVKSESTSITFLSWNKLAVLDYDRQSIRIVNLIFDGLDIYVRGSNELSLQELRRSRTGRLTSIASQDGALYVSDGRRIYNYIEDTDELVVAVDYSAGFENITDLQVSTDSFYVVDGNDFHKIGRTIPVEVILDGAPHDSQLALLELYFYLYENRVLPSREQPASRNFDTLEEFLFENSVFIAGSDHFPVNTRRVGFFWSGSQTIAPTDEFSLQYEKFERVFCSMNAEFCDDRLSDSIFLKPVQNGDVLWVPNLVLNSRFGTREVFLDRTPVNEYLDEVIISAGLRERVTDKMLLRQNKQACARDPDCLIRPTGKLTLPYESWSVAASVLAIHFYNDYSPLDDVKAFDGADIFSQQIDTKQRSYSDHLDTPDGVSMTASCSELSGIHKSWEERIKYPFDYTHFISSSPRVAVVEHQVIKNHDIFEIDHNDPTWHELDPIDVDLIAKPLPSSAPGSHQQVDAIDVFIRNLHHGTHVSAIIGGRDGHCWAGLLPESRLVHINASGSSTIRAGVFNSHTGLVRVVNFSQGISDDDAYKNILVDQRKFQKILFVLAAGNDGIDLNQDTNNLAVRWGQNRNVIVVAGLGNEDALLGEYGPENDRKKGSNWGKQYVDLAAPARDIVSASAIHKYGPATGTSQAAPTVAAAAAYLMDPDVGWGKSPGQVKARLIATADWETTLADKVWGGMLNLGNAVRFPNSNLVSTFSAKKDTIIEIDLNAKARFKIENWPAETYERDGADSTLEDRSIRLTRVVSIKSNDDADPETGKVGTFRVVFIDSDDDTLRIMPAAELSGEIECSSARRWIPDPDPDTDTYIWQQDSSCDEDIDISQVYRFYHAMNYQITW